ncbi:MAG: hypothetical protein E7349_02105 [Clostridiales bacterium]|nr:hypothetical protein [Clostridiales bacterium]
MKKLRNLLTILLATMGVICLSGAFKTLSIPAMAETTENAETAELTQNTESESEETEVEEIEGETQKEPTSNPIIHTYLGDLDVSSLKMKDGAAVRLKDNTSRNGMRFTAYINKNVYNTLEQMEKSTAKRISVGYGMLIIPYDYHQNVPITVENIFGSNPEYYIDGRMQPAEGLTKISGWYHIDLPEEDFDTREKEVYCSIINIAKNQLTREFIGVAYIEYTEIDNKTGEKTVQYYMTEVEESNARSMVYVAQRAIQDTSDKAPNSTQKTWLKDNYTTCTDVGTNTPIPDRTYTYTVNHIKVDPLGREEIVETIPMPAVPLYTKAESGNTTTYTANTVSVSDTDPKGYDFYTYDGARSHLNDIVYANHKTELNYYYNEDHCDIQFSGTRCTMEIEGKQGAELSYISLNGAESFFFKIIPDVGYSHGTLTVSVDGKSVTPNNEGKYEVSLSGKANNSVIKIEATLNAGTISDQVFEDKNYESKGDQSQNFIGTLVGWFGYGKLTVDEEKGTITSNGGSLELSGDFILNALNEGYTHMVCDVSVSGGIGTLTKLETVNGSANVEKKTSIIYKKTNASLSRTDRIDLTVFKKADGTCDSLLFRGYRSLWGEGISSTAKVQLSNIKMYRSSETTSWGKFIKTTVNNQEVNTPTTNAYAAYKDGNLVIETMEDNTYFERPKASIEYDISAGVSMSFAFKYLTKGENTKAFFYHFKGVDEAHHKELTACHVDENGFSHLCVMPETVRKAAELGENTAFHFGLEKPGTAMLILANSGANKHSTFDSAGNETIHADTWGYPYSEGIFNEFLQVKDAETAKAGVEFNINMRDHHTITVEITADFDFEGFWYGNNEWSGYKAGMRQFKGVDSIKVDGEKTIWWTEITYSHAYMEKGFNIHWRDDNVGDTNSCVGTMQLRYTLAKDASVEYYAFVPQMHQAGIEVSEFLDDDGVKVERLTGVVGTIFTMPVLDTENEKTISLTVSADWDFSCLKYLFGYNEGDIVWENFAPGDESSGKYKQTITVTAVFKEGFKISYKDLPKGMTKGTIDVSIYVDNFDATGASDGDVVITEVLQTEGWTKLNATNVQKNTVFDFAAMAQNESISLYLTANFDLSKAGITYGTPDGQMVNLPDNVEKNTVDGSVVSYTTFFTYCNPEASGFRIALNYVGANFPTDAWIKIQYAFTEFKIKHANETHYTAIFEENIKQNGEKTGEKQAQLYSNQSEARFWLDTRGYSEIVGKITLTSAQKAALTAGALLYGHGWNTAGVVAVDPNEGWVESQDGSTYSYAFTYHENLESGFCIYYTNEFTGEVTVNYQLYTIKDIAARQDMWEVEQGGSALNFKSNGHIEYTSNIKEGNTGYEVRIKASVFEIAYKNGYDLVGLTFASNNLLTAHILNDKDVMVKLEEPQAVEHAMFNVSISDLYTVDENGNMTFNDMVLRFDSNELIDKDNAALGYQPVSITIENVHFGRI